MLPEERKDVEEHLARYGLSLAEDATPAAAPESPSVTEWLGGRVATGVQELTKKTAGLLETVGGTDAAAALRGALQREREYGEQEETSPAALVRKLEERRAAGLESLPESIAGGLVESIPMLPMYMGASSLAGLGLGLGAKVPYLKTPAAALKTFISPEKIAAASVIGGTVRTAAHGAVTGATLGAITEPGRRLEGAKEEAAGFAMVAPGFYLAGRAVGGIGKWAGRKLFASKESNVSSLPGISEEGYANFSDAVRAAKDEGHDIGTIRFVQDKDSGEFRYKPAEPVIPKEAAASGAVNIFDEIDKAAEDLVTKTESGASKSLVRTEDGKYGTVPDYGNILVKDSLEHAAETMDIVLTKAGKPFKTEYAARGALKANPEHKIVKLGEDGFALGKVKGASVTEGALTGLTPEESAEVVSIAQTVKRGKKLTPNQESRYQELIGKLEDKEGLYAAVQAEAQPKSKVLPALPEFKLTEEDGKFIVYAATGKTTFSDKALAERYIEKALTDPEYIKAYKELKATAEKAMRPGSIPLVEEVKATKPLTAVERARAKRGATNVVKGGTIELKPAEEVKVDVAPTGKVETKVGPASERTRVQEEFITATEGRLTAPQQKATIALLDTLAEHKVKLGEIESVEDVYKVLQVERGKGTPLVEGEPVKGQTDYLEDGKTIATFFDTADFSTAVHKVWHVWEKNFLNAADRAWVDQHGGALAYMEQRARAFERFFAEGFASVAEMKEAGFKPQDIKLFQRFKNWLLQVYAKIRGTDIDVPMDPSIENLFRRQLGLKEVEPRDLLYNRIDKMDTELARLEKAGKTEEAAAIIAERDRLVAWERENLPPLEVKPDPAAVARALEKEGAKLAEKDPIKDALAMAEDTPEQVQAKAEALDRLMKAGLAGEEVELTFERVMDKFLSDVPRPINEQSSSSFTNDVKTVRDAQASQIATDMPIEAEKASTAEETARRDKQTKSTIKTLYQKGKASKEAKERVEQFGREMARYKETEAKLIEMMPAWRYPATEVTNVLPRLEKFADAIGMGKEMAEAVRTHTEMKPDAEGRTIYHRLYDRLLAAVTTVKDANLEGTTIKFADGKKYEINLENIGEQIRVMKDINDTVAEWRFSIENARPGMLKEEAPLRDMKSATLWAADLLKQEESSLNRKLNKVMMGQINIQHLAQRFPRARKMFTSLVERMAVGDQALKDVLQGNPDKILDFKGRPVGASGFSNFISLHERSPELGEAAWRILRVFEKPDAKRLDLATAAEFVERLNLSKGEKALVAQAVSDVRETLDYVYASMRQDFIDNLPISLTAEVRKQRIKTWEQSHPYRNNYLPRVREGDMTILAFDQKAGKTVELEKVFGGTEAKKAKEAMAKRLAANPDVVVSAFPSSSELGSSYGIAGERGHALIERIAELATRKGAAMRQFDPIMKDIEKATSPEIRADLERQLEDRIASVVNNLYLEVGSEYSKSLGLRGHFIGREVEEGIPGYLKDGRKALLAYSELFSSYMGRQHFIRGGYDGLVDLKGTGIVQDYARKWFSLALQAPTKFDGVIGFAKQAAFLKYLTSLKPALVVTLDKITAVGPRLGMYAKTPAEGWKYLKEGLGPTREYFSWEKQISLKVEEARATAGEQGVAFNERQAIRDARASVQLPKGLSEFDVKVLQELKRQGFLDAVFMRTMVDDLRSEIDMLAPENRSARDAMLNSNWKKLMFWSSWAIGKTESYGRASTALSAARMFKAQGMSEVEAIRAAGLFTIDSHGYYNKANVPLFMMSGAGKAAKLPFTFRVFEHHTINMLAEMLSLHGKGGKVAAMQSLGALMGLGGLFALPFASTAVKAYQAATGVDLEAKMRKITTDWTKSERLADLMSYGVTGALGVPEFSPFSFRSSVEVGRMDWSNLIFGAPGQVAADVAEGARALAAGDTQRALEKALPAALANPYKAYQRYKYGVAGPTGELLKESLYGDPLKLTAGEAVMQAAGATPIKIEKAWAREGLLRKDQEYWNNKRRSVYTLIERAVSKGDEAGLKAAFERVDMFNKLALEASPHGGITLIGPKEIQQSLKDKMPHKKGLRGLELLPESQVIGR